MSGGGLAVRPPHTLTEKQKDFCRYFLQFDGDRGAAEKAYRLAYNAARMTPTGCRSAASELLHNHTIQEYITERRAVKDFKCDVTAAQVLERMWRIATADPNKLIRYRRICCRYCYGIEHHYQYADEEEYALLCDRAITDAGDKKPVTLPSCAGGFGFNHTLDPHPDCPKCRGEGYGDAVVGDTNKLEGAERMLYKGIEIKPNGGIKVLMHDQAHFIEMIARHLGMFNDRQPGAANGNPQVPAILVNAKSPRDAAAIYARLMSAV